jgi:branched-chain amino acid transport system ATP-binding protein
MTTGSGAQALCLQGVSKRFGHAEVIRSMHLTVHAGERVGIIGPNGAGKSTLFDLISGRTLPNAGRILLHGQRIDGKPPYAIHRMGLSRSFQVSRVFSQLSVVDNLRCGALWRMGYRYALLKCLVDLEDVNQQVEHVMAQLRLDTKRHTSAAHLTYAEQRTLDLGIALVGQSAVVLLDEPTAGLSRTEADRLADLIRAATVGKTLLIVEHDMSVMYGLADKIAVLVAGELLAFGAAEVVRADPRVQAAYLGELA